MIKWITIAFIAIFIGWGIYCTRPNNGIIPIGKDAVLLTGECITINWDASVEDAYQALTMWQQIKDGKCETYRSK